MPSEPASKTIVVCDDHVALLRILKHLLSKKGFDVLTASNGADGLALVRNVGPDILLLDIAMPELDGIGVLRLMKEIEGKKPYTLVLSGQESVEVRQEALSLGANEVWKKPFSAADLMNRIDSLISDGTV